MGIALATSELILISAVLTGPHVSPDKKDAHSRTGELLFVCVLSCRDPSADDSTLNPLDPVSRIIFPTVWH